ncbi:MAG: CDP-alcohol phosphatidyltransferase family protein [Hyphomicrobiales bacterium]
MRKANLPLLLIYSRLVLGLLVVPLSLLDVPHFPAIALGFLGFGLVSDFFDGYIARHLGVSTERLRRLDSTIDVVFFLGIGVATIIRCPDFLLREKALPVMILVVAEAMTYAVSYSRFQREVATHSIGAKIWTLFLFATLVELLLHCRSGILFEITFWLGLVTRLEIAAILLVLRNWTTDVPSVWHALQLRKGRTIKRHKFFNG